MYRLKSVGSSIIYRDTKPSSLSRILMRYGEYYSIKYILKRVVIIEQNRKKNQFIVMLYKNIIIQLLFYLASKLMCGN